MVLLLVLMYGYILLVVNKFSHQIIQLLDSLKMRGTAALFISVLDVILKYLAIKLGEVNIQICHIWLCSFTFGSLQCRRDSHLNCPKLWAGPQEHLQRC